MASHSLWTTPKVEPQLQGQRGLLTDRYRKLLDSLKRTHGKAKDPKSLICLLDEHSMLAWYPEDSCLHRIHCRSNQALTHLEVLALTNSPTFEVECLELSPTGRFVSVTGTKGIVVVELPRKWPAASDQQSSILCKSWTLSERLFVCNRRITLLESRWHPASDNDQHIVLLTNDNAFRIFNVTEPDVPVLHSRLTDAAFQNDGRNFSAFANSLGEAAISFDFSQPIAKFGSSDEMMPKQDCIWPIYLLRGNGDILIFYHSLANNKCQDIKLIGPLKMLPTDEDNYGYDACKLVCLNSSPVIVVVATSSGLVYHCISLPSTDYGTGESGNGGDPDDSLISELQGSISLLDLPKPTLYVFEALELPLSLTPADGDDFACPIRMSKDPFSADRYYLTHSAGLHAIHLPVVGQLSSSDLSTSEPCVVEHLICTRPLGSSLSSADDWPVTLGLTAGWRNGSTCLTVILSSGELLSQSLTPLISSAAAAPQATGGGAASSQGSVQNHQQSALALRDDASTKIELTEHIRQILKRSANMPTLLSRKDLKAGGDELLQLVLNATQVLKQEYLQRQELAGKALEKRVKALSNEKQVQLQEFSRCDADKTAVIERIKHLTLKYESVLQKQRLLAERLEKVLDKLNQSQGALSDAEKGLTAELRATKDRIDTYRDGVLAVENKFHYQNKKIPQNGGSGGHRPGRVTFGGDSRNGSPMVQRSQWTNLQNMLDNEETQIRLLLRRLNLLKEQAADNH